MSLNYCEEQSFKCFGEYILNFINQVLETELHDESILLLSGLSASHFAQRSLDFEFIRNYIA